MIGQEVSAIFLFGCCEKNELTTKSTDQLMLTPTHLTFSEAKENLSFRIPLPLVNVSTFITAVASRNIGGILIFLCISLVIGADNRCRESSLKDTTKVDNFRMFSPKTLSISR